MMKNERMLCFCERVYEITRQIPYGRVTSYGIIAKCAGSPQASRMVGWALNKSRDVIPFIPAHRVVNRNGILTGKNYFEDANQMQKLLEQEGIIVKNDRVINLKLVLWDPFVIFDEKT